MSIRHERAQGRTVRAEDIDTVERMGDALSLRLLTTPPEEVLEIKELADYLFEVADSSATVAMSSTRICLERRAASEQPPSAR